MSAMLHSYVPEHSFPPLIKQTSDLSIDRNMAPSLQRRSSVRGRSNRHVQPTRCMQMIDEELNEIDQKQLQSGAILDRGITLLNQESSPGTHQPVKESNPLYRENIQPLKSWRSEVDTPTSCTFVTQSPPGLTPSDIHEEIETPASSSHAIPDVKKLRFKQVGPDSQAYSPRITKAEWQTHRQFIEKLHNENKSRMEMIEILASAKDFRPSIHQLNAKMKVWKLKVYNKHNDVQENVPGDLPAVLTSSDQTDTNSANMKAVKNSAAGTDIEVHPQATDKLESEKKKLALLESGKDEFLLVVDPEDYKIDFESIPDYLINIVVGDGDNEYLLHTDIKGLGTVHELDSVTTEMFNADASSSTDTGSDSVDLMETLEKRLSTMEQIWLRIQEKVTSIAQDGGTNYYNAMNDMAQLMYGCRMFSVAFKMSQICYNHLRQSTQPDEYRIPFAELNCVRSATFPWQIDIAAPMAAAFYKSCLKLSELPRQKLWSHAKEVIGDYDQNDDSVCSSGTTLGNDFDATFWDHYFVLEYDDNSEDQVSQIKILKQKAIDNAKPLNYEQCPVWKVLRECCTLAQGYEGFLSSDRIGCHFVRKYASQILSCSSEEREALSSEERATEIISFKSEIHALLVIGHWVSESMIGTLDELSSDNPAAILESHLHTLLNLPLTQRASEFQRHQKAVYQVSLEDRKAMDSTSPFWTSYIIDTAILLAKASIHLRNLVRYTWSDPVLGQHLISPTSSLRSKRSITSRSNRDHLQTHLLARDTSKCSTKTHSSGYMSICSRPSLRFGAVTGLLSSNSSIRSTTSDVVMMMDVG